MSHAAKITKEEGALDFREAALPLHNKVALLLGWVPFMRSNLSQLSLQSLWA